MFERVRNRPRTLLLELEQRHIERFVLTVKRVEHVDEAYDTLQYGFVMKDGSVKLVGGVSSNTLDLEIIDRINEQLGVEHGESMYRLPTCANTTVASGNNPTGIGDWYETNKRYSGDRYGAAVSYVGGKIVVMGGGCTAPTRACLVVILHRHNADIRQRVIADFWQVNS